MTENAIEKTNWADFASECETRMADCACRLDVVMAALSEVAFNDPRYKNIDTLLGAKEILAECKAILQGKHDGILAR